jgi:nucleoside phosphorylase
MSVVFVFAATKMESGVIARMMSRKSHLPNQKTIIIGEIGSNQIVLVNTGMGPRNARIAAGRVFQSSSTLASGVRGTLPVPDAAIITGLAGSLVRGIGEGEIVAYRACLSATGGQGPIVCSSPMIESVTRSLGLKGLICKSVTGISSDRIAQADRDRERLAETGAVVVDMESFDVAACSAAAGVPVAAIRAVSDSPGSRMPDLNRALNPGGEFNRWALAPVLAGAPLATLRLFKGSKRAIGALEQAMDAFLSTCRDEEISQWRLDKMESPSGLKNEHSQEKDNAVAR